VLTGLAPVSEVAAANRSRIAVIAHAMQSGRHSDGVPPPR